MHHHPAANLGSLRVDTRSNLRNDSTRLMARNYRVSITYQTERRRTAAERKASPAFQWQQLHLMIELVLA